MVLLTIDIAILDKLARLARLKTDYTSPLLAALGAAVVNLVHPPRLSTSKTETSVELKYSHNTIHATFEEFITTALYQHVDAHYRHSGLLCRLRADCELWCRVVHYFIVAVCS